MTETINFIRRRNAELSGKDYGFFMNMSEGSEKPEDVFGANLARLREVKAKYDLNNVFSKGVPIAISAKSVSDSTSLLYQISTEAPLGKH